MFDDGDAERNVPASSVKPMKQSRRDRKRQTLSKDTPIINSESDPDDDIPLCLLKERQGATTECMAKEGSRVGTRVRKQFGPSFFPGVVEAEYPAEGYFHVRYQDGDQEDVDINELNRIMVSHPTVASASDSVKRKCKGKRKHKCAAAPQAATTGEDEDEERPGSDALWSAEEEDDDEEDGEDEEIKDTECKKRRLNPGAANPKHAQGPAEEAVPNEALPKELPEAASLGMFPLSARPAARVGDKQPALKANTKGWLEGLPAYPYACRMISTPINGASNLVQEMVDQTRLVPNEEKKMVAT